MAARKRNAWLELLGPATPVDSGGVELPQRAFVRFAGGGVTVTDDPTAGETVVTVHGELDTEDSDLTQDAAQAETSDATPTPIGGTFVLPTDSLTTVDASLVAIKSDASVAKIFSVRRHFLNDGGTITASTQEDVGGPDELGGSLGGGSVSITRTGAVGRVEVTGVAATAIRWVLQRQRLKVTAAASGAPTVDAISPTSGAPAGGTAVTITGAGFTGATGATVGGVALTSFAVVNDTMITGTTGAHASGAVDVVVTGPGGSGTLAAGYTYSGAWTPASLGADLVRWFRADTSVTGSAPVTAWGDLAAAGAPDLTATDANFNNQASIDLDGATDYFQGGALAGGPIALPITVVMIFRETGGTYLFDGIGNRVALLNNLGDFSLFLEGGATFLASGVAPSGAKQFVLAEFAAAGQASTIAVDQLAPQASSSAFDASTGGLDGITLGAAYSGAAPGQGQLAEAVVVKRKLSGPEKASLAAYVNARYAMAVA